MSVISARALYLSPSASHPRDYGNRNRVWQTASYLKRLGFEIHFVLYPMESDWARAIPASSDEMRECWASFTVIPPSKELHRHAEGRYHEIDEWWDAQIGNYLNWLFARQHFDMFFVNYTFLSKAFEYAPRATLKILDTHDMFSGRLEMLEKVGAKPEFFYTTPGEESKAFNRADYVIAIKDSEAALMRQRSTKPVMSVPYFPDVPEIEWNMGTSNHNEPLKVGFIGALNTVNVLNMQRFLQVYQRFERIFTPPLLIKVAGDVSSRLAASRTVKLLGKVDDIDQYYRDIDVIVAPLMFSTGLKIKIAEALSYGKPVVAMENAFDGFQATDEYHVLRTYDDVCRALMKLAFDRNRLAKLLERSAVASRLARRSREQGFNILGKNLRNSISRILFITDAPIWKRNSLHTSRLAQWADLCSDMLPTIVIYTGDQQVPRTKPDNLKARAVVGIPSADETDIGSIVRDNLAGLTVTEIVLAVSQGDIFNLANSFKRAFGFFSLDVSSNPQVCSEFLGNTVGGSVDILCVESKGEGVTLRGISVAHLRHVPLALYGITSVQGDSIIAALCDPTPDDFAWLEHLKRRLTGSLSVMVVGNSSKDHDIPETDLFGYIQQRGKPALIMAVGRDKRKASQYEALARYINVGFERLSGTDLPSLRVNQQGDLIISETLYDEFRCITDARTRNVISKIDATDGGWSTYWFFVQDRRERLMMG